MATAASCATTTAPSQPPHPTEPVTDPRTGLSTEEARRRAARCGSNAIEARRTNPLLRLLSFFWGPIPWMIEVAAILSGLARRWEDLAIIGSMLAVVGTLATVYGWFVAPIGWTMALAVWGYALAWLLVNSAIKMAAWRLLRLEHAPQARHLARVAARLQPFGK